MHRFARRDPATAGLSFRFSIVGFTSDLALTADERQKSMSISGLKLSYYAGDVPNVTQQEKYMNKLFAYDQQEYAKICSRFMQENLSNGTKTQWFNLIKPIDGTSGGIDTLNATTGMIEALAGTTSKAEIKEVTRRYTETQLSYIETLKRKVQTSRFRIAPFIERVDIKAEFGGIRQSAMEESVKAWNRKRDSLCAAALFADVEEGYDSTSDGSFQSTTMTFADNCTIIDPTASESLNIDKMHDAYEQWDTNDVDYNNEKPVLVIGPKQKRVIRNDEYFINGDYNANRPLQDNTLDEFVGADVIVSNRLSTAIVDDVTYRKCALFLPSGMLWCPEEDFYMSIDKRADRNDGVQILQEHCSGALRLLDTRIIGMWCRESATEA